MNLQREGNENMSEDIHKYDIVLYGATSFVGKLVAEYLNQFLAADKVDKDVGEDKDVQTSNSEKPSPTVTWAIAGRDQEKLEQVKKSLNSNNNKDNNKDLPIIIADSTQQDTLDNMAQRARVIISTVGPYLLHGEPLIKACVNHGTDYVDLTGEAIFIKNMMDNYSQTAQRTGARIINSCGFDSIPSDLGVYYTQMQTYAQCDSYCDTIHMRVKALKGGLSGGTIASMATIFSEAGKDKQISKALANPYLLNDDDTPPNTSQPSITTPKLDKDGEHWLAPFVMDSINTKIVHRSNQRLDYLYGREFQYDEAILMSTGIKGQLMSYGMSAGIMGFATAMRYEPSRTLLNEYILPKSGEGPSEEERENGYFDIRFQGIIAGNEQIQTKVTGVKDPGYGSTCRMLAQSALCLLQDVSKSEAEGGFWTPASAMGDKLINRLEAYAGIEFTQLSVQPNPVALQSN